MTREDLRAEILDDLNRTDMAAAASAAISSAISLYEKERWWFLEGNAAITSSASQVYYDLPSDFQNLDSGIIKISDSQEPLVCKGFLEIDEKDDRKLTGEPVEYCFYENKIRFYPIAHTTTYTITLSYHKTLETTASASNAWTNIAKDLIRYSALREIRQIKLNDPAGSEAAGHKEIEAYNSLRGLHRSRVSTGRFRKTTW